MKFRGINYDVGRQVMGQNWRPEFSLETTRRELEIIKHALHCNAVRITGQDLTRLVAAANAALELGLIVICSPDLWDHSAQETLEYLGEAALAIEPLRRRWGSEAVMLSVGSELTLFMQGVVPGSNFLERMSHPDFWNVIRQGSHNPRLNEFLAAATTVARRAFQGKVTYFAVPLERVDWEGFDFVGLDWYRDARTRDIYGKVVERFGAADKPMLVGEFGCCTFQGAADAGGAGWQIVDFAAKPPQLKGAFIRDEKLQAREDLEMLRILDAAGVTGAFLFTFAMPTYPFDENPLYDLDMASYSIVKTYTDHHGKTYPDMMWEPKAAFGAVADYFAQFQNV